MSVDIARRLVFQEKTPEVNTRGFYAPATVLSIYEDDRSQITISLTIMGGETRVAVLSRAAVRAIRGLSPEYAMSETQRQSIQYPNPQSALRTYIIGCSLRSARVIAEEHGLSRRGYTGTPGRPGSWTFVCNRQQTRGLDFTGAQVLLAHDWDDLRDIKPLLIDIRRFTLDPGSDPLVTDKRLDRWVASDEDRKS